MSSSQSAFHRPQRENLSLKTNDIDGAIGKHRIHERKLVYTDPYEREYVNPNPYGSGEFKKRMYEKQPIDPRQLPDPYELEQHVKQTGKFNGQELRQLGEALKSSVVYSRESDKYKLPNDREVFLHNYENIDKILAQKNRRRYKSGISYQNPFYRGVVLPPELTRKGPIKLPKHRKDLDRLSDEGSISDKLSDDELPPPIYSKDPQIYHRQNNIAHGENSSAQEKNRYQSMYRSEENLRSQKEEILGPSNSQILNYRDFESKYGPPAHAREGEQQQALPASTRSGYYSHNTRDAVTSQIMSKRYGNELLNKSYRKNGNPAYLTINDEYGMF